MSEVLSSAAGLLVLFRLIVMATVGGILAAATGLSTRNKDGLAGLAVGIPSAAHLVLTRRAARG